MIKFGTAGFRGIIGDNWTKENIQKIGFAFRKVVEGKKKPVKFIIGYDNRFMGRESAIWFCEAVCCDTVRATFMNVSVPTPFIAYKSAAVGYGIVITASHNPYIYNGIKLFHDGKEGDDEFTGGLEKHLDAKFNCTKFDKLIEDGFVTFSEDLDDYADLIASSLDIKTIKSGNTKVLFNPMHGSGAAITRRLFDKMGVKYDIINEEPDPMFGGNLPSPYPHMLTGMAAEVIKGKYHFGVAIDGDADRITVIDADGKFYDCNYLSAAFYYYLTQIKKQKGGAVKNFLTSNLINKLCTMYGFNIHETPVGFKYLGKIMETNGDVLLGAESGGMGFRQISFSKDGVATAAFLVDLVATMKKSIGAIVDEIVKLVSFPSHFVEYAYPFDPAIRADFLKKLLSPTKPKFAQEIIRVDTYQDGYKAVFENDYWCAARISGTESAVRAYTEMPNEAVCDEVIKTIEQFYDMPARQK